MEFRRLAPFVLVALLGACSDEPAAGEPFSGAPCPTSLGEVAEQVFRQSCIDAGCHGSADRAGGLDLETSSLEIELFGRQAALCDGQVRIVPGDATRSYLIAKLSGTNPCGSPMPIGDPLDSKTVDCIASWIDGLDVSTSCETCGGALCVDLMTSPEHCGACGEVCPGAATCVDGACTCPNDLSVCDSSCVDLGSDPMNCGSCGTTCGDLFCLQGDCTADCGTLAECSGACVDLMNDANHCGQCGTVCGPGASCADGQCQCRGTAVSFETDLQPVLTSGCASMGCHDGVGGTGRPGGPGGSAPSLDLTAGNAYQSLLETSTACGPVVVPGDAEASILIGKLTGTNLCMGSQMPKGDPQLAPEVIDAIATWICQGAANN